MKHVHLKLSGIFGLLIVLVLVYPRLTNYMNANNYSKNKIQHIIVIMQENHAFDNYFGTYPGAIGIPPNECMPYNLTNATKGCVKPFLTTDIETYDLVHNYSASVTAYDNGKMDGFVVAENSSRAMTYYNNITIPNYWNFAHNYTLDDMFFSSVLTYSLPNHWYAVAGQSPQTFYDNCSGMPNCNMGEPNLTLQEEYLYEANLTETIGDLFKQNQGISWRYYDYPLNTDFNQSKHRFSFWNPFASQPRNYYQTNFVNRTQIFSDIDNHNLPDVSWVIPSGPLSEHQGDNITYGMYWTTSIVDAIMNSSYWNSTVIIVTWDDYGGYFDTVKPPKVDALGYGFRVPAIIISPYSKQGIDSTAHSFDSILRFIEWRYNLHNLTRRDSIANNLNSSLDLTQKPLAPHPIPVTDAEWNSIAGYLNQTSGVD